MCSMSEATRHPRVPGGRPYRSVRNSMSLRQVEVGLPAHPLQDPQQVGVVRGEQGATPQQQEADKPGLQLAEPDGEAERQRQDQDAELAQIGRASWRERVWQKVSNSGV